MAETTRQTQDAPSAGDACENAAGAHIERWARGRTRTARDTGKTAADRRETGPDRGDERVWGGDRGDPRLFYFQALLASGWFFGGVTRAFAGRATGSE